MRRSKIDLVRSRSTLRWDLNCQAAIIETTDACLTVANVRIDRNVLCPSCLLL